MSQASLSWKYRDSRSGTGRVVISAWAIVVFVILLFAGMQAVASLRDVSLRQASPTGAIVPRHNSDCVGPRIPNAMADGQCRGRANTDAYTD